MNCFEPTDRSLEMEAAHNVCKQLEVTLDCDCDQWDCLLCHHLCRRRGMNPGRELDALVAEKVMGWTYSQSAMVWYPSGLHPMANVFGHTIPNYSTSIEAAWQVVEKITSDHWIAFTIICRPKKTECWHCMERGE